MTKGKTRYSLYAMPYKRKTERETADVPYRLMTAEHILVYLPGSIDPPKAAEALGCDEIDRLSMDEREWLFRCNLDVMSKEIAAEVGGDSALKDRMLESLSRLEKELEAERQKMQEEKGGE